MDCLRSMGTIRDSLFSNITLERGLILSRLQQKESAKSQHQQGKLVNLPTGLSRRNDSIVAREPTLREIAKLRRIESRVISGRTLREGVTGRAITRPEYMEMAEIRAEENIPAARKEKPI